MNVSTLAELTRASPESPWFIDLVLRDTSGEKATVDDLLAIEQKPTATALRVSGLDQRTFETLIDRYGSQFSAIHFWKCPHVEDLSALEQLSSLTHVAYYWNQRSTKLWDLTKTPKLAGLRFEDFSRLRRLDDLASGSSLRELTFGDAVWMKNSVDSLEPVATLSRLERLSFAIQKIQDGRIQPLASLAGLKYLECPTNLFSTEQLAWLRARLPEEVQSRVLAPVVRLDKPLPSGNGQPPRDVIVLGKRKPFLNSRVDEARINRYVDRYWVFVHRFRANPELEPKST